MLAWVLAIVTAPFAVTIFVALIIIGAWLDERYGKGTFAVTISIIVVLVASTLLLHEVYVKLL